MSAAVLELSKIGKSFGGTRALDGVDLTVHAGEVVALLGENGAGKSTLMKVLSGVWPGGTYEGEIRIGGSVLRFRDTRDAHAAGIAMIHQELSIFPELTVAEHLELDRLPSWIQWSDLFERTQRFLDRLGLGLKAHERVGDLSIGGQQLVEIARALYREARILVFDEPTSALTDQEVSRLYSLIEDLRAEGKAIIYITHRMDEVFRLADRIVVLRDGCNAGEASMQNGSGGRLAREELEPRIISWMVGRSIEDIYPTKTDLPERDGTGNAGADIPLLRVEGLTLKRPSGKTVVRNLTFSLRRGEILGLGGLLGAGRSETFESIFGVLEGSGPRGRGYEVSGSVWIKDRRHDLRVPRDAIGAKMAYVSEDRKGSGLVLNQSIRHNMSLPFLASGSNRRIFLDPQDEVRRTRHWASELKLKSAHLDQPVSELSGGNQQKVVLAKWLMTEPEILFLDEPTRGIDIGAKVEIYHWIQKLSARGIGILLASSEMPELLGLCHRILVLREGRLSAELSGTKATQEEIMRAASL